MESILCTAEIQAQQIHKALGDKTPRRLYEKAYLEDSYKATIFPKDVRSIIRDILLYNHRSQLKEVAKV